MLKDCHGYNYIWAFVCHFSKILATLPDRKTDTAANLVQWYYCYLYQFLGMPEVWLSDNTRPFVSEFLATINQLTGTKHHHSSSHHPQMQGAIEITNAALDQRLHPYMTTYQDN